MNRYFQISIVAFWLIALTCPDVYGDSLSVQSKVIDRFNSDKDWEQRGSSHIPSGNFGFEPGAGNRPAKMWFRGVADQRSHDTIYSNNINEDVTGYDELVITLKATPQTHVTIDVWFNGNMVVPRGVANQACTGDWQTFRIAIGGTQLTGIGIGTSVEPGNKAHVVLLRDIRVEKQQLRTMNDLNLPDVIVIPTPKELTSLDKTIHIPARESNGIELVVGPEADSVLHVVAAEFCAEINAMAKNETFAKIVPSVNEDSNALTLVLQINPDQVPTHEEAYAITPSQKNDRWMVNLTGADGAGIYWATKTFKQLVSFDDDAAEIVLCNIKDWPSYAFRSMSITQDPQSTSVQMAMDYKINRPFINWWQLNNIWANPGEAYKKSVAETARFALDRGLQVSHTVCPYRVDDGRVSTKNKIRFTDESDLDRLFATYEITLSQGNRSVSLFFDDGAEKVPDEDIARFGSMPEAHAYGFHQFYAKLKSAYPDAQLGFLPQPYSGTPTEYMKVFGEVADDVMFYWTGPDGSAVSLRYSDQDIKAYHQAINGNKFIVFDNTPGQRYGLARRIGFFDPYADAYGNLHETSYGVHAMATFGEEMIVNAQSMIIAEYMWNADDYNAEDAVAKVMAHLVGRDSVEDLLMFRHHYLKIAKSYPVEKKPEQMTDALRKRYTLTDKQFEQVDQDLRGAAGALERIKQRIPRHAIIAELSQRYSEMDVLLRSLNSEPITVKDYDPKGEVVLDLDEFRGAEGYRIYGNRCEPRYAIWSYGNKTPFHTLNTRFNFKTKPGKNATLEFTGQDSSKTESTQIEVLLNGQTVFLGDNTCVALGWSDQRIALPAGLLRIGENELIIRNLEDSASLGTRWFMLSACILKFE